METREVRKHAGWYGSYMSDAQGQALVECMEKRIQKDDDLFERLAGELELCDDPREESPEMVLASIRGMLRHRQPVTAKRDYFEWTA